MMSSEHLRSLDSLPSAHSTFFKMRFAATFTAFALAFVPLALSTAFTDNILSHCESPEVIKESYTGAESNVKVQALKCANKLYERDDSLEKRQSVIAQCGAQC